MKRSIKIILSLIITLFVFSTIASAGYTGRVIKARGRVLRKSYNGKWRPVYRGQRLRNSDKLKTGSTGICHIKLNNGNVVKISKRTFLEISNLRRRSNSFYIKRGNVSVQVAKINRYRKFKISTPTAVAGVRGTQFRVNVGTDLHSKIFVKNGSIEIKKFGSKAKKSYRVYNKQVVDIDKSADLTRASIKRVFSEEIKSEIDKDSVLTDGKHNIVYFSNLAFQSNGTIKYFNQLEASQLVGTFHIKVFLNEAGRVNKIERYNNRGVHISDLEYVYKGQKLSKIKEIENQKVAFEYDINRNGKVEKFNAYDEEGKVTYSYKNVYNENGDFLKRVSSK